MSVRKTGLSIVSLLLLIGSLHAQTLDKEVFAERRQRLMDRMDGGVAVFQNTPVSNRNSDVDYPYRSDSDFYYLTGYKHASAAFILAPAEEKAFILFVQPKNLMTSLWLGDIPGIEGAMEEFGADTAYAFDEFVDVLSRFVGTSQKLYYDIRNERLSETIRSALPSRERGGPEQMVDVLPVIHELRVIKGPEEIKLLEKTIGITCQALVEVMKAAEPGMYEYELGAIIDYVYKKNGSQRKGFPSIIGSGPRSTIFHYEANDRQTRSGDVVLMDIGAEYGYYSADVTRTIPIDGRFSQEQRDIYEIVLAAQEAAIEVMVPGNGAREYYTHAEDVIKESLYRLGLITDRNTMWQHRAYYYPYIGHWLGLDPHDAGSYGDGPAGRPLEPGMVLTVEPGLYFGETMVEVFRQSMLRRERIDEAELDSFLQQVRPVFEKYMHIGVRIEDDILITSDGNRILSAGAPKTVKDIETTMKKKSRFN